MTYQPALSLAAVFCDAKTRLSLRQYDKALDLPLPRDFLTMCTASIRLLPVLPRPITFWQFLSISALITIGPWVLPFSAQQVSPAQQSSPLTIRVDATKRASYKIPRSIYGAFLEPIGNSIYPGVWAELLENPSFEDNLWSAGVVHPDSVRPNLAEIVHDRPELAVSSELGLPLPWEPLFSSQGARYAPEWNDAANSERSLLLMALPDHETAVRQRVYLPVHRTLRFVGSVYLKHLSGLPEVEVSVRKRDHPEDVFAAQKLSLSGNEWRKYEYALEVPQGRIAPLESADYVIAVNHETRVLVDQASLMPDDNIDGLDPDMVAMSRAMKPSIVRFGGNFTSAYHWRDGIGPRDKRRTMLNVAWGMPEYNQFGTDEFLRFCELIGAEPQIALNLGTGTPDEGAAWVQYVDEHWGSHEDGLLWELGNELWGTFQVGYPTLSKVAERTKAFSDAVLKVDPHARLIATGADPDHFQDWNAAQLSNAPASFQFLSTHFVVGTNSMETPNANEDFIERATFALPIQLGRQLRKMHDQVQNSPGRDVVKTAFTEWLYWAPNDTYPRYDNMGGAIGAGGFFNMLLRNADIVPISDMTGIVEFGGIWKKRGQVFGTPSYWAFRMYSTAHATIPVEASSNSETYNVTRGESRLPEIENVPYLDVVAALDNSGNKLTLFCVNRDLTRDLPAKITIAGFRSKGNALVHTLHAESIYEKNDETQPEHIHPQDESIAVSPGGFTYSFRRESVSVIELNR